MSTVPKPTYVPQRVGHHVSFVSWYGYYSCVVLTSKNASWSLLFSFSFCYELMASHSYVKKNCICLQVTFNGSFDHMNIDSTRYYFETTDPQILSSNVTWLILFIKRTGRTRVQQFSCHYWMACILWFAPNSVQTLEIIDPLHTELWGTSNKKKSLFQMLKTTKTTGGYAFTTPNYPHLHHVAM